MGFNGQYTTQRAEEWVRGVKNEAESVYRGLTGSDASLPVKPYKRNFQSRMFRSSQADALFDTYELKSTKMGD